VRWNGRDRYFEASGASPLAAIAELLLAMAGAQEAAIAGAGKALAMGQ